VRSPKQALLLTPSAGGLPAKRRTQPELLAAGVVDEMLSSLVRILFGGGQRLFDRAGADLHSLGLARTVPAPGVCI
jgi:hypothetical protein